MLLYYRLISGGGGAYNRSLLLFPGRWAYNREGGGLISGGLYYNRNFTVFEHSNQIWIQNSLPRSIRELQYYQQIIRVHSYDCLQCAV